MPKLVRGELTAFNVYPERARSRLHYRVRVFKSERALKAYLRTGPLGRRLGRYGRAMCSSWRTVRTLKNKRTRVLQDMGELLFTVRCLGTEAITHECTHAALNWAERIRLPMARINVRRGKTNYAGATEERFCYGLGQLTRQVVQGLYDRKVLVDTVAVKGA